jgi:hypothetical protein
MHAIMQTATEDQWPIPSIYETDYAHGHVIRADQARMYTMSPSSAVA